jgi:L-ascorbate metabolism protein UlaG (beta-lactamase superfamily)
MKITYIGHSGFVVEADGHRVVIDPFLTGNPLAAVKAEDVKADAVLLTHGHSDHIGDALPIALANGCPIISNFEIAAYFSANGAETVGMNTGGSCAFEWGSIKWTQAFHSSSIQTEDGTLIYGGQPSGLLLTMGGRTFYHTGDTALFSDLKMIGDRHAIDVCALPIGDFYTMGPDDALQAAEWVHAKLSIPIHHSTFPGIKQDALAWVTRLESKGLRGIALQPGQSTEV